jgi:hypothetical protein
MHVPSSARRCVVFIGEMSQGKFIPRATGFLVVTGERDRAYHVPYLVTAEHVISGMAHADKEIFVRVNLKNGTARVESAHNAVWSYHPTAWERTDVAVTSIAFDWDVVDHECIPLLTYDPVDDLPLMKPERQFGLGDETFTVGLFRSHYGAQRNMPIIRIGNIAAMPEEPIKAKFGKDFIEGYLVEMRSIAGLSGSPVFVDRPMVPPTGLSVDPRFGPNPERVNWFKYHFLGLIHGHFDTPNPIEDMVVEDDEDSRVTVGINTGMGVVIPAKWILETLYQDDLVKDRERALGKHKSDAATPDD